MDHPKRPQSLQEKEPLRDALDRVGSLLHERWLAEPAGTFAKAQAEFACTFFNALEGVLRIKESEDAPWWRLSCAYQDIAMRGGRGNATMNRVLDQHARGEAEAIRLAATLAKAKTVE